MAKSPDAFRTISEVAEWLDIPTHVLRFWESRFTQIKPLKRAGGRRYYRPNDMRLIGGIKVLLHDDGLTIRGVQKLLKEKGIKHVAAFSPDLSEPDDEAAAVPQAPVPADSPLQSPPSEVVRETRADPPRPDTSEKAKSAPIRDSKPSSDTGNPLDHHNQIEMFPDQIRVEEPSVFETTVQAVAEKNVPSEDTPGKLGAAAHVLMSSPDELHPHARTLNTIFARLKEHRAKLGE